MTRSTAASSRSRDARAEADRAARAGESAVDAYLAALPKKQRTALDRLRLTIRAAAPLATEGISYRIPTFRHCGQLVGFAAFPEHCTFFVMSTGVTRKYAAELEAHPTGKGSIRFPAERPLPSALVTKLVKARIAENEHRRK